MKKLMDVRLTYLQEAGKPGFKLHFTFAPNDYFEDTELTKTYYYQVCICVGVGLAAADVATGASRLWRRLRL